jgi:sterol desaturase/sphingolipid hydroxylase (fatty acid hydroxylase superfamily)
MKKFTLPKRDLTELATPLYFATMAAEAIYLHRRRTSVGESAGNYAWKDTVASLSMGTLSLALPLVSPRILRRLNPRNGSAGKVLLGIAAGSAAVSIMAGRTAQAPNAKPERADLRLVDPDEAPAPTFAEQISGVAAVVAIATGGVVVTSLWSTTLTTANLFKRRILPDLGEGIVGFMAALIGWDFIYYWNHRFMHTSRYMWAMHVVHHSSEHYNLSTALRQPVAEPLTTPIPYGALGLFGVRPSMISLSRGINLLWQYWIHTETVRSMGVSEEILNSPSAHRVHHGSNRQYLDRNHGGILILWDRLFGTFEPEEEDVVYGLTTNIHSFNPVVIAGHEYVAIARDISRSRSWRERFRMLVGPPVGPQAPKKATEVPVGEPRLVG